MVGGEEEKKEEEFVVFVVDDVIVVALVVVVVGLGLLEAALTLLLWLLVLPLLTLVLKEDEVKTGEVGEVVPWPEVVVLVAVAGK